MATSPPTEEGHGRDARSPVEIPRRGWMDILWRVWTEIDDDRVFALAAGVAYYALLALFPAIGVIVSLYGFVADPASVERDIAELAFILPSGGMEVIGGQLHRLAGQPPQALGLAFLVSLAISLWSANAGVKALFDALNVVYDENEKRGFFRLNAISLLFTALAIIFVVLALVGVVIVPVVLGFIGLGSVAGTLVWLLRWPALLLLTVAGLSLLYRFGPSRREARWQWISWGSAVAALVWIGGSMLFSWYVARFDSYGATYGSLGAVVGFLTWIWLSTVVFLVGAELNAEAEHQTARDSTVGGDKPMGRRGAVMADTLGRTKPWRGEE
ncbi:YihY/virulence factor BrkB family protein [Inquilinus sp.]|jgi:membrane protein|uniref:YihY/virulence factor BrkB family protein n=1 Tax=Inquilinus sp. TaxID=1932117 RepID=UPI0037836F74